MIEESLETYFKRRVRETGGEQRKVVWPNRRGAPDRLAGWKKTRRSGFVELKRPKGKAEAHQAREHERLRALGFQVDLIDTREAVDAYVKEMSGQAYTIAELELSVFTTNVLGRDANVSLIAEVLDAPDHPLRAKLRARDLRDMAEIRKNLP